MDSTRIGTYQQARPEEWLKDHPGERWRCDIYTADGGDFHGVGATEADALFNASFEYLKLYLRK